MSFAHTYIAPKSAVKETDFGAENVASHPAPVFGGRASAAIGFFEGVGGAMSDKLLAGDGVLTLA